MFPTPRLFTSCISFVLVSSVTSFCPRGFEYKLNNSCYFFSHDMENWTGALISCAVLEGHLVEIDSQEEQAFLAQKAAVKDGVTRWIGLSQKVASTWTWATSRKTLDSGNITDWASGKPENNQQGDGNCVIMDQANAHAFDWVDVNCDRLERYICEAQSG